MTRVSPFRMACSQGFSLIEVTLAIGLVSFGLLSVLGLLPGGLTTLRQAIEQTEEGQIMQKLTGEILLTPYSQLDAKYANREFYYDEAGNPVSSTSDLRYKVQTILTNSVYPGSTNAPVAAPIKDSIQAVQVNIVKIPGAVLFSRYTIQVPNSGN